MTPDQQRVLHRCKMMIKTAFPGMTGKFVFRLSARLFGKKGVAVGRWEDDLRIPEPGKEVTEVKLDEA